MRGTLAAPAGPFPRLARRPQPRSHLTFSALASAYELSRACSLCALACPVFLPSHEMSLTPWPPFPFCSVFQDASGARPFVPSPWRRACSFHRLCPSLCAQNIPLPHLGLAPVSCHPIVPRPPTLRCLFYFRHRISC